MDHDDIGTKIYITKKSGLRIITGKKEKERMSILKLICNCMPVNHQVNQMKKKQSEKWKKEDEESISKAELLLYGPRSETTIKSQRMKREAAAGRERGNEECTSDLERRY